jgi:SAM-dependent methyltransferase
VTSGEFSAHERIEAQLSATSRAVGIKPRRSTARDGGQPFVELCLRRLPPGRILNLGAGFTEGASLSQQVFDVDLDPDVLQGDTALSVAGDAAALPFRSGIFDGALLKDVLEHVVDPVAVLSEVARVAGPEARIIVTVPRAIPRAVWADPTHLRGFTERSIRWTLEMGGWRVDGRVDRVGSIPGAGHVPFLLEHSHQILRLPGLGHLLGLNWMATARPHHSRGG